MCGRGTAGPGRGVAAGPAREPLPPAQSGLRRKPAALPRCRGARCGACPPGKRGFLNRGKARRRRLCHPSARAPALGGPPRPPAARHAVAPSSSRAAVLQPWLHGVIDYVVIRSFIKYLLSTHCELGVGLSPGNAGRVRQALSPRDPDSKEHSLEGPTPTRWPCLERPSAGRGGARTAGDPRGGD